MHRLLKISDALGGIVEKIGRLAAWVAIALIVVILYDVVSRRFFAMGSSKLQEFEWHLHTVLFMFCLGIGYIHDTHVRIDIIRERLGRRTRCWIEILGCILFLVPFCLVVIYYGAELTHRSWIKGEISSSATGLPFRWLIKSAIPIGMSILLLSSVTVLLRQIVTLSKPELCARDPAKNDQDGTDDRTVMGAD